MSKCGIHIVFKGCCFRRLALLQYRSNSVLLLAKDAQCSSEYWQSQGVSPCSTPLRLRLSSSTSATTGKADMFSLARARFVATGSMQAIAARAFYTRAAAIQFESSCRRHATSSRPFTPVIAPAATLAEPSPLATDAAPPLPASDPPSAHADTLRWTYKGAAHHARLVSDNERATPKRVVAIDDTTAADAAFAHIMAGTALVWCGSFQNARQMMAALVRRMPDPRSSDHRKAKANEEDYLFPRAFHLHRRRQSQRARALNLLLLPLRANGDLLSAHAPDYASAVRQAFPADFSVNDTATEAPDSGRAGGDMRLVSLRELLGLVGAREWRKNGVHIPDVGTIHPHYGVFSPIRGEYVDLVLRCPLPLGADGGRQQLTAFDIGTGTGVLAAALALKRGVARVIATDSDARALACARDNIDRLGLSGGRVSLVHVDASKGGMFPPDTDTGSGGSLLADLIVCNPPWVPGRAHTALDRAVYDPDSRMLRGFLGGVRRRLRTPHGEGWLILSDLAEHLKLRSRAQLLRWVADAGLRVVDRLDVRPTHAKAARADDPLHAARAAEVTSLWRLAAAAAAVEK